MKILSNRSRKVELAKKIVSLIEEELKPNGTDHAYSLWDAILERRSKRDAKPKRSPKQP